jgi:hypothetical protein
VAVRLGLSQSIFESNSVCPTGGLLASQKLFELFVSRCTYAESQQTSAMKFYKDNIKQNSTKANI